MQPSKSGYYHPEDLTLAQLEECVRGQAVVMCQQGDAPWSNHRFRLRPAALAEYEAAKARGWAWIVCARRKADPTNIGQVWKKFCQLAGRPYAFLRHGPHLRTTALYIHQPTRLVTTSQPCASAMRWLGTPELPRQAVDRMANLLRAHVPKGRRFQVYTRGVTAQLDDQGVAQELITILLDMLLEESRDGGPEWETYWRSTRRQMDGVACRVPAPPAGGQPHA
jgi:hypothetical protein